jgi:hypothetical protein
MEDALWKTITGNLAGANRSSMLTTRNTPPEDLWRQRSQKLLADIELAKAGVKEEGRRNADGTFAGDVEVLGVSTGKFVYASFKPGLRLTLFGLR